jgi:hypothetical protein
MNFSRQQKLVLALDTLEFVRNLDAIAARAMALGLEKTGFIMAAVSSWNEAAAKAAAAVDMVEADDKAEEVPVKPVTDTGKASN